MKIRLWFFGDIRTPELKEKYNTIERQRADAWLHIALVRRQRCRLYGMSPVSLLRRQAE